jgi:hypothetical protein
VQLDGLHIEQSELVGGKYGTSTAAAVLSFKTRRNIVNRSYQNVADDIVGKMTIAELDKEIAKKESPAGTVPILALTPEGECFVEKAFPFLPVIPQLANPNVVAAITALVPQVRTAIRAANFRLLLANPHVTHQKQKLPTGPLDRAAKESLLLLDKVFDFFKFNDPRPVFDNFLAVYRNMEVALNRSFETSPLVAPTLFVANPVPAMEAKAAAYTSHGAAFVGNDEKNPLGLPANRIYLCNNLLKPTQLSQIIAVVHELAHFVSGSTFEIVDNHLKGHFFTSDPPKLQATPGSITPQFQNLRFDLKVRNAEHYGAFAAMAAGNRLN